MSFQIDSRYLIKKKSRGQLNSRFRYPRENDNKRGKNENFTNK